MHGLHKWMPFGYLQDGWKVRPSFTLTVGVRYEFFNVFHEIYGRDLPFDRSYALAPDDLATG